MQKGACAPDKSITSISVIPGALLSLTPNTRDRKSCTRPAVFSLLQQWAQTLLWKSFGLGSNRSVP